MADCLECEKASQETDGVCAKCAGNVARIKAAVASSVGLGSGEIGGRFPPSQRMCLRGYGSRSVPQIAVCAGSLGVHRICGCGNTTAVAHGPRQLTSISTTTRVFSRGRGTEDALEARRPPPRANATEGLADQPRMPAKDSKA